MAKVVIRWDAIVISGLDKNGAAYEVHLTAHEARKLSNSLEPHFFVDTVPHGYKVDDFPVNEP